MTGEQRSDGPIEVLFVDDDANVLSALRRMFHSERDQWHLSFSRSGAEALELVQAGHFDVIVTDMQMPRMDGAELLSQVRTMSPATVRIILSGQANRSSALRVATVAHQFINKPAEPSTLKAAITRAGGLGRQIARAQIRAALGAIDTLPSPSATLCQLNQALLDPEADARLIARIIETDTGLTSKVLQLVNSAFFCLPREVVSIQQAVAYLGLDNLQALAGSAEMFKAFDDGSQLISLSGRLQHHGLIVGRVAAHILPSHPKASATFLGSLMHELGLLLFAALFPDGWRDLKALPGGTWAYQDEIDVLGASHSDLGAYLLSLWGFPLQAVELVARHHELPLPVTDEITPLQALQFADILVAEQAPVIDGHTTVLTDALASELGVARSVKSWRAYRDEALAQDA